MIKYVLKKSLMHIIYWNAWRQISKVPKFRKFWALIGGRESSFELFMLMLTRFNLGREKEEKEC